MTPTSTDPSKTFTIVSIVEPKVENSAIMPPKRMCDSDVYNTMIRKKRMKKWIISEAARLTVRVMTPS